MFGIIFWIVLLSVAVCSGIKLSTQTGYFKKSAEKMMKEGNNSTGTYTDANGRTRSLTTNKPVNIVRNNKGEKVVYGSKGEYLGNLTKQQNNKREREQIETRVSEALNEDPNVRYVMAGVQANDNAKAKGITGNIYVDVKEGNKKYVKRYFNYPVGELGNKNLKKEYFGDGYLRNYKSMGCKEERTWDAKGEHLIDAYRASFVYWMDISDGKLVKLVEDCEEALKKKEDYEQCINEAKRFMDYFNTCQDLGGFLKINHAATIFMDYQEKEQFYCSADYYKVY